MIKVSIIIPTHNVEKYFAKCINSCLLQTLKNIEIIIIDDASTDKTPDIIKKFAQEDSRIKAFYMEENRRQGAARNVGILNSQGEYILFLDADDWIEEDACEKLYKAANGADMCGGDMFINTDTNEKLKEISYQSILSCTDIEREFYLKNNGLFTSRIHKREFLIENNLFFPEGIYYEDLFFNTLCGFYFKDVVKLNYAFYHYYQRESSTVHLRTKAQYDRINIAEKLYEECCVRGIRQKFSHLIEWKYLHTMAGNILYICLPKVTGDNIDSLEYVRKCVKKTMPEYKKKSKCLSKEMRFFLKLVMSSPKLAVFIYKLNIYFYWEVILNKLKNLWS